MPNATLVPYLSVDGARRAIDWYVAVFGAELVGEPYEMPDGRIGHAELRISDATLYLSDAHPEIGVVAPTPGESTLSLMLAVDDADATLAELERAGGRRDREPETSHGERRAWAWDPFGHRWGLHSPADD
jgi:PhnB protein